MQPGRDALTAIRLLTKLLVSTKQAPERVVTDGLGSYVSAARYLRLEHLHFRGRLRENNRLKIHTFPSGDESERCRSSNRKPQRSASSIPSQPSTTPSTPSDI